jgi:hypothetical protein
MPRKPAASNSGTPFCASHVARVWRSVWRVTPGSFARLMTLRQLALRILDGPTLKVADIFPIAVDTLPAPQMSKNLATELYRRGALLCVL